MARAAPQGGWPRTLAEFKASHAPAAALGVRRRLAAADGARLDDDSIIKNSVGFALHQTVADRGCTDLVDGPQILTDEISAIPDVVVTCAPLDLATPVVAEPTIIVEVMSPASEADDTGRKWPSYQKISSLKHYLVLAQDRRLVQIHSRAGDLWRERFVSAGTIEPEDTQLGVAALYAQTDLAA
jgi:hypothetical protein